jgi:hypothetical protein
MTKDDFYTKLVIYQYENKFLRKGQATFNLMYTLFPNKANKYRGSNIDPFHNDKNIDIFVNTILKE